jgi:hypothetical protein
MKTLIGFCKLLLLTSVLITTLHSQIPNPGFEDWTDSEPDGWFTTNFPPLVVNVTQTSNSHSGNWAVRGEVIDFMIPIPPYLNTGSQSSTGFPINQKFNRISGYYQFSPVADDHFLVSAAMGISTPSDTTIIGIGAIAIGDAVSEYTLFSFDIIYFMPGEPNWANITISIIDTSCATPGHVGSTMLVDDLDIIVGFGESEKNLIVEKYMLGQNYPNPFNPTTTISFRIPKRSFVTLRVFDVLGNEVMILVNEEKTVGNYQVEFDAIRLPSGVYFYQLNAVDPVSNSEQGFMGTKKMILLH